VTPRHARSTTLTTRRAPVREVSTPRAACRRSDRMPEASSRRVEPARAASASAARCSARSRHARRNARARGRRRRRARSIRPGSAGAGCAWADGWRHRVIAVALAQARNACAAMCLVACPPASLTAEETTPSTSAFRFPWPADARLHLENATRRCARRNTWLRPCSPRLRPRAWRQARHAHPASRRAAKARTAPLTEAMRSALRDAKRCIAANANAAKRSDLCLARAAAAGPAAAPPARCLPRASPCSAATSSAPACLLEAAVARQTDAHAWNTRRRVAERIRAESERLARETARCLLATAAHPNSALRVACLCREAALPAAAAAVARRRA